MIGDSNKRDVAYLDVAFHAWLKKDFQTARIAAGKITQEEAASALRTLIDFGEGSNSLNRQGGLPDAEAFAGRLPQGIERSTLFLGIAGQAEKSGDPTKALEETAIALQAARSVNDARRPFLILIAAGRLAGLNTDVAHSTLAEAIKEFNQQDDTKLRTVSWNQTVEMGPLVERFPLKVQGIEFGFGRAFRAATSARLEDAALMANDLKSEALKALAMVEVGRSILQSLPEPAQNKELVVRVGEDGIRKSALKSVMPLYPDEAVKNGKQGAAVAELQYNGKGNVIEATILEAPAASIGEAVINAVKQWKFKTSTFKGEPISIRGKLTFYFLIDKEGKGRVENPKQFQ